MKKKRELVAREELDVPGSRVVRAPRREAATTDITLPRLDVYVPRPGPHHEPATRDLASAFGSELAHLSRRAGEHVRAAVAPFRRAGASVAEGARRTLEKNAGITLAAASAGLLAGVVLTGFPANEQTGVVAKPALRALEAADMCEAPPAPIALLRPKPRLAAAAGPKATPRGIVARPSAARAPARAARGASSRARAAAQAPVARKRVAPPPTPASDPGSQARRDALLEEARRAEKAELASAYFERTSKRRQTRIAGR
jgi:hypothetical protein